MPGVDRELWFGRANRIHPIEGWGEVACFGISGGIPDDLAVVNHIFGVVGFKYFPKPGFRDLFDGDSSRPHQTFGGDGNGAFDAV